MQVKSEKGTERIEMMPKIFIFIHFIILFSFIFSNGNQFAFTGSSSTHSTISLQSSTEIRQVINGFSRISKEG